MLSARLWADFSSFVPLRNVREGARDFGNENFHCGSFLVTVPPPIMVQQGRISEKKKIGTAG